MSKIAISEVINKIEQLDLYLEEAGWERINGIKIEHTYKNYRMLFTVETPSNSDDDDEDL